MSGPEAAAAAGAAPPPVTTPCNLRAARWSLLAGNFAIGCGVMVVPGTLNDLSRSFAVSVAVAGQLITVAAVVMALGAPLLAAAVAGWDRRRLLALAMAWYALGHAASALMPDIASLTVVRGLCMLAAAVFTPQAAAAIAWLAPAPQRARAITFLFLGWSAASVFGVPLHTYIGESLGWRYAFWLVALLSAASAVWVWRALPDGVRPAALNARAWKQVFTHPALMAMIAVTALFGAGQFTLLSYLAPYFRHVLGASPGELSLIFGWYGLFGLLGNVLLSRTIDRVGAARAVFVLLLCIAVSFVAWPWGTSLAGMALVIVPWGLGAFAANSAQQARLGLAAPVLSPALMALNTSAIYIGQAVGAAGGGAMVLANEAAGRATYAGLHWVGLAWIGVALATSLWAARRMQGRAHV